MLHSRLAHSLLTHQNMPANLIFMLHQKTSRCLWGAPCGGASTFPGGLGGLARSILMLIQHQNMFVVSTDMLWLLQGQGSRVSLSILRLVGSTLRRRVDLPRGGGLQVGVPPALRSVVLAC